jgi:hypothetical protein
MKKNVVTLTAEERQDLGRVVALKVIREGDCCRVLS